MSPNQTKNVEEAIPSDSDGQELLAKKKEAREWKGREERARSALRANACCCYSDLYDGNDKRVPREAGSLPLRLSLH